MRFSRLTQVLEIRSNGGRRGGLFSRTKHLTVSWTNDIFLCDTLPMGACTTGNDFERRTAVKPPPKKPYAKPTLTKHKALKDITAGVISKK